jgi:hypothetical protein
MVRAPMSRMDILSPEEISSINYSSELVKKYNQTVDRESAYEMLGRKIESIEKEEAQETARKEWEMETKRTPTSIPRTTYSRSRRSVVNPVVKVLTSATFIRGVMGILKKTMR